MKSLKPFAVMAVLALPVLLGSAPAKAITSHQYMAQGHGRYLNSSGSRMMRSGFHRRHRSLRHHRHRG